MKPGRQLLILDGSTVAFTCLHGYRAWLMLLLVTLPCGCGTEQVPMSDVASSEMLIREALEAWKAGEQVKTLREQFPPIYVSDESWSVDQQLADFELLGEGTRVGTNVRFRVRLTYVGERGRKRARVVDYVVTTQPARTIARVD